MKITKTKKLFILFAVFVCIIFMMSTSAFAAADYETEAAFLTALGVGNANISVAEQPATREEFAVYLAQAINMPKDYLATDKFSDVTIMNSGYDEIGYLCDNNIISGYSSTEYRPANNVSYDEAIKCIVSALGYETYASHKGGFSIGYANAANECGVKLKPANASSLTKGEVFSLLYKMLHSYSLEMTSINSNNEGSYRKNDELFVTTVFDLEKRQGLLSATKIGSIYGNTCDDENEICIDFKRVKTEIAVNNDYLGCIVDYYADKDTDIVKVLVPQENTTYKFVYDSILSDTTPKCIKYSAENGKTKSLDVKSDAYYMYNGRPMPFPTAEMLNPKPGEVIAIDNDDDGKIDVVIIWEYTSYVSKQVTSERVTLKERKFALEEEGKNDIYSIMFDDNDFDVNFINETGYMDAEQLNKNLKADMVLSICESDDQSLMTVFVSEKKVTGKVSVVSEDTLVIGETEVSFFEDIDFKKYIGKSLTVYLDKNGYAAAYEETDAEKYAVLHSIGKTESISPDTMIKLFLDDNSFKTFTVGYDKKIEFSVNGGTTTSRVAGKDLYDITLNGAEELEKQLIKYSLDETGTNIKSIYLAENASNTFEVAEGKYEVNEGEVNEDEFRMNLDFKGGTVKTGYSKLRVTDYSNLSNINNRTFYEVSQRNTLLVFISDDEKKCSYTTFNDYNGGVDGIIADFKAYDKQEVGWYKVILCNADAAVEGKISLGDPCMFITGVKYVFDKENDSEGKVFTGVVSTLNNFKDVTIKVPEDDLTNIAANNYLKETNGGYPVGKYKMSDLEPGYLITYSTNMLTGEVSAFSIITSKEDFINGKSRNLWHSLSQGYNTACGTVLAIDSEGIRLSGDGINHPTTGNEAMITRPGSASVSADKYVHVLKYNRQKNKFDENLYTYDDISVGDEVFAFSKTEAYTAIKLFVIYE